MKWRWIVQVSLVTVPIAGAVMAADQPVVEVSRGGLEPARIEVHVGEMIRWRTKDGIRMRIEFDPHLNAHEVIKRAGEARAVFTRSGEHWYVASIVDGGYRHARGVVTVRASESDLPDRLYPACAPESSDRICFAP